MVVLRRNGNEEPRPVLLAWRVGVFFLAAGVWLAGVLANDQRITGAAIVLFLVAILLRLLPRRAGQGEEPEVRD